MRGRVTAKRRHARMWESDAERLTQALICARAFERLRKREGSLSNA